MTDSGNPFLVLIAVFLWGMTTFITHFLSNRRLPLAGVLGMIGGLCAGIYINGIPIGLVTILVIGIEVREYLV